MSLVFKDTRADVFSSRCVHVILEAGQLKPAGPIWPRSLASILSLATFMLQGQIWAVATETWKAENISYLPCP